MKQTMKEAGYRYKGRDFLTCGHLLQDIETGKIELWFCNKGHASYGIKWRNTELEFACSIDS